MIVKPTPTECSSVRHNPPAHIYIRPGQVYTHVCPCCSKVFVLTGNSIAYTTQNT